jgi:pyruvate ferredoxin oxidoreductase gamma subunit
MKGLKENGKIIINSSKSPEELKSEFGFKCPVASVNASKIALETIKLPITNTAMMGALEKVTEIVKMESLIDQLRARFGKKADVNIEAMTKAYNETVMEA